MWLIASRALTRGDLRPSRARRSGAAAVSVFELLSTTSRCSLQPQSGRSQFSRISTWHPIGRGVIGIRSRFWVGSRVLWVIRGKRKSPVRHSSTRNSITMAGACIGTSFGVAATPFLACSPADFFAPDFFSRVSARLHGPPAVGRSVHAIQVIDAPTHCVVDRAETRARCTTSTSSAMPPLVASPAPLLRATVSSCTSRSRDEGEERREGPARRSGRAGG